MAELRMKGLAGIDLAPLPTGGGIPADGEFVSIGVTYRDEASLKQADPTSIEHFSNENDAPEESDMISGVDEISLALIDWDPDTILKHFGGTVTGTGTTKKWSAPASQAKVESAMRIRSKNGQYFIFPRVSYYAKKDYDLAPKGIAKILIKATVMQPTGTGIAPVIKGTLA
jgi:hypothetical protein